MFAMSAVRRHAEICAPLTYQQKRQILIIHSETQ